MFKDKASKRHVIVALNSLFAPDGRGSFSPLKERKIPIAKQNRKTVIAKRTALFLIKSQVRPESWDLGGKSLLNGCEAEASHGQLQV